MIFTKVNSAQCSGDKISNSDNRCRIRTKEVLVIEDPKVNVAGHGKGTKIEGRGSRKRRVAGEETRLVSMEDLEGEIKIDSMVEIVVSREEMNVDMTIGSKETSRTIVDSRNNIHRGSIDREMYEIGGLKGTMAHGKTLLRLDLKIYPSRSQR